MPLTTEPFCGRLPTEFGSLPKKEFMETIYCDGSLKYICCVHNNEITMLPVEDMSHNEAEYEAILLALDIAEGKEAIIYSDSQLAIRQINGGYRVKNEKIRVKWSSVIKVREHRAEKGLKTMFEWIPRGQNQAGLVLE